MATKRVFSNSVVGSGKTYDYRSDGYDEFLPEIQDTFSMRYHEHGPIIFITTASKSLYELFLDKIPERARQHYNCNACRSFVNKYGRLAFVNRKTGKLVSAFWDEKTVPPFFHNAVNALRLTVELAEIAHPFHEASEMWGIESNWDDELDVEWHHMHLEPPEEQVWLRSMKTTADQHMSEQIENYNMLMEAARTYFDSSAVTTAVRMLKNKSVHRPEKAVGQAEWFRDVLKLMKRKMSDKCKRNRVWLEVAAAPDGYCHIRTSVLGSLLDDLYRGFNIADATKRFNAKMDPTKYRRPTSKPKAGNLKVAANLVDKLKAGRSFNRRFARVGELQRIWQPQGFNSRTGRVSEPKRTAGTKLFEKVPARNKRIPKSKTGDQYLNRIPRVMGFTQFRTEVLPGAKKIQFQVPYRKQGYAAFTTASYSKSNPILQWDSHVRRNPFSMYVYAGGSRATDWNLHVGQMVNVTGVSLNPHQWFAPAHFPHLEDGVTFILSGCRDLRYRGSGLAIFPENLKGEFHSIRSSIEALSNKNDLTAAHKATGCGVRIEKSDDKHYKDLIFHVWDEDGFVSIISIDRYV